MAADQNNEELLGRALARIAELNRELGRNPDNDPVLMSMPFAVREEGRIFTDPRDAAAHDLIEAMRKRVARIEANASKAEAEYRQRQVTVAKLLEHNRNHWAWDQRKEDSFNAQTAKDAADFERQQGIYAAHAEALKAKIERLETDPHSMFLPLGTVVRFKDVPHYVNSFSQSGGNVGKDYPVANTVGVVTRLNHGGEYPIGVSIRRPYIDGYGDRVEPDSDMIQTFLVDPERIEVIEPGLLPGGVPCEAYGYVATHACEPLFPGDAKPRTEMVIEADGFLWNFQAIRENQVEAIRTYHHIDEMEWVTGPLDPEAAEHSAPRPY